MRESTESFQPPENTETLGQKCLRWYHPLKMIPILSWIQQESLSLPSFETVGCTVTEAYYSICMMMINTLLPFQVQSLLSTKSAS